MVDSCIPELPALFLDAASPVVWAGVQVGAAPESCAWRPTSDEAGVGLFQLTDDLLREHSLRIEDLCTIVFCAGPGSLLGVRLAAIALRMWGVLPRPQPLRFLAYRSLELVAADLLERKTAAPFTVVNDARRGTWNVLRVEAGGAWTDVQRHATTSLPQHERIFFPAEFPSWQERPAQARGVDYRPARVPFLARQFPLLREAPSPEAFLVEMPTYRTWTPEAIPAAPRK